MADRASADGAGAGLVGRRRDLGEERHGGADSLSVRVGADMAVHELHDDITFVVTLEKAVDGRDADGSGATVAAHRQSYVVLGPRLG